MDYYYQAFQMAQQLKQLRAEITDKHLNYPELDTLMGITIGHLNEISHRLKVKEEAMKEMEAK